MVASRVAGTIPILIAVCLLNLPALAQYSGGSGTADDPYQIATAEDLMLLGETPEDYDKHFKLMADIDLSGYVYDRAVIAPDTNDSTSGFDGVSFTGTFDGNGLKILHLFISGNIYPGLFGQLGSGAKVENLGIGDIKLGDSGQYAGGLAGYNRGKITNCYSTIRQASGDTLSSSRGGLVGYNAEGGTITDCYSNSSIAGSRSVGGLVGTNYGRVTGCYSTGNVHGGQSIGGLVGDNKGTIRDCYSTSQFCQWIGAPPTTPPKVIWPYCFGGLVGRNSGIIVNCYSIGGSWPGWLVPVDPNKPIWPTWPILQLERLGGLVGTDYYGNVIQSFWDIQTSRLSESDGGVGLTTLEMKTANTFLEAGWDFMHEAKNGTEDMWWILEGQSYPRLRRQYGLAFSHYPQNRVIGYIQDINEPIVIIQFVGIVQPVILSWLSGGSCLYHDVYFGEDEEAVADATTESPHIYCGRQPAEITTYDPGTLGLAKTYYWRIDEVNILDPNSMWKGNVWSFTTANFLVVDDFESYNDLDESHPGTNRIFQTWIAPFTLGNEGAMVGHADAPFAEQTIVHSGSQSMPFHYDNTNDRVNSWTHFVVSVQDWTANGADTLSLWFRGDADNGIDAFYIAVNGVRLFHPNPNAVVIDTWTQWLIPFSDLTAVGVNMQNVASLNIGVGDRARPSQNARGILYIDDITVIKGMS